MTIPEIILFSTLILGIVLVVFVQVAAFTIAYRTARQAGARRWAAIADGVLAATGGK